MYKVTVGLEIHAELKTATKMFCACRNDADEKVPNKNICPVCMAHPGSLPVINKEAVRKVLLVGKAVGGTLAGYTEFDRKNYFYPDIPKGYQISQYQHPLVSAGVLAGVALTRIHLEEDTARSQHPSTGSGDISLVDYNRAGVPLLELVTEPVIHSAQDAGVFARELQLLLRTLGAGEANMEKGEMRVEANISVSKATPSESDFPSKSDSLGLGSKLGTKVEVKNLNSFRSVERAIAYEIERQSELLRSGGAVAQETRGWDEIKNATYPQRKKEGSADYRYFPDPDIPSLRLGEISTFRHFDMPELPWQQRERLRGLGFLQEQDIEQLIVDPDLASLFGAVEQILAEPTLVKTAANFILNDIVGQKKKDSAWPLPGAAYLAEVVRNYNSGIMASPQAKRAILSGEMVAAFDDREMPAIARKVIDANPAVVADYKAGKGAALQFLIGQGMRESKGRSNPQALTEAIQKILG